MRYLNFILYCLLAPTITYAQGGQTKENNNLNPRAVSYPTERAVDFVANYGDPETQHTCRYTKEGWLAVDSRRIINTASFDIEDDKKHIIRVICGGRVSPAPQSKPGASH
jgi:hypothetical protein